LSACLAACFFTGPEGADRWTFGRWRHLTPVQSRLEKGDFEGAINQYQSLLSRQGGTIYADFALFDLGLLYVHYDNPNKDFKKSLFCFTRVLRECPGSSLTEEAKIWVNLLEALEKAKRVDIELDEKQRLLNNEERDERTKPAGR
jgi:outer membrane protein assembly factor BamD (BamD/ComL family)